jgi:hypothetical protein
MDLAAWMNIFNGSNKEDVNAGETNSYMSAGSVASSLKKNSVRGDSPQRSVKIRGDDGDDASLDARRDRNTLELAVEEDKGEESSKNDYDSESDDNMDGLDDEMKKGNTLMERRKQEEEEKMDDMMKAEAEREKKEHEDFMKEFYWDYKKKDYFDPKKRFGLIEDEE